MTIEDFMNAMMSGPTRKFPDPKEYRRVILYNHRKSVMEDEEWRQDSPTSIKMITSTDHGSAPKTHGKVSKIVNAQPITLREIQEWHERRGDKQFMGRVLLCTTLDWPFKMASIMTVVEDQEGRVDRLAIYNMVKPHADHRAVLPKGSMLAILDPYYKYTLDGGRSLRVDNPQTLVVFGSKEEFLHFKQKNGISKHAQVKEIDESKDLINAVVLSSHNQRGKMGEDHKNEGNHFFQAGQYQEAISCYTSGLQMNTENITKTILLSNRAECSLRMLDFRSALVDACSALEVDPSHTKSIHRKFKALVGLGQIINAKSVLPDYAKNTDLDQQTRRDMIRGLAEATDGKYDVYSMMDELKNGPRLHGHADYRNHDVNVVTLPNKGRALVASKPIKAGAFVMVTKAASIVFLDEVEYTTYINYETMRMNSSTQGELVADLAREVMRDPSLGEQLYNLYDGSNHSMNADPLNVDIDRIKRIVGFNAFNGTSLTSQTRLKVSESDMESQVHNYKQATQNRIKEKVGDSPTGLWIQPSYLNHSCNPNCIWFCVGDFMFVVTAQNVEEGEELTTAYTDPMKSHIERSETLQQGYEFVCSCERCDYFVRQPHLIELEQQVESQFESVHKAIYLNPHEAMPILLGIVEHCEQHFGTGIKFTSSHFMALTAVVSIFERRSDFNKVIEYSRKVSTVAALICGRGSTTWVMSRMHEISAMAMIQRHGWKDLLLDTFAAFKSIYHTNSRHFQEAYCLGLQRIVPNLSKILK